MAEILFLVERGGVETERADDVVDLCGAVLDTLLGFLSRGVGSCVFEGISECSCSGRLIVGVGVGVGSGGRGGTY